MSLIFFFYLTDEDFLNCIPLHNLITNFKVSGSIKRMLTGNLNPGNVLISEHLRLKINNKQKQIQTGNTRA